MKHHSTRTYGLLCALGGLVYLGTGVAAAALPRTFGNSAEPVAWFAILLATMHALTLAGVLGLARSGAAGDRPLARTGLPLAGLGTAAAVVAEPMFLGPTSVAEPLIEVGSLVAALGLVIAGIAVLRAHRWLDIRRYVPLALGLYFLTVFMPWLIAAGEPNFLVLGCWGVLWALLGISLVPDANAPVEAGDAPQPEHAGKP
jgi:hypothetical protein